MVRPSHKSSDGRLNLRLSLTSSAFSHTRRIFSPRNPLISSSLVSGACRNTSAIKLGYILVSSMSLHRASIPSKSDPIPTCLSSTLSQNGVITSIQQLSQHVIHVSQHH